jgi:tubulin monoglycylase TTLL3/8
VSITTKVGLTQNLRELIWYENVDVDTFYPLCFDLKNEEDLLEFQNEFKFQKA